MIRPTRTALFIALGCVCSSFAWGQEAQAAPRRIDIPAGDLVSGLDALAAQSGTQLLYRADQLKGARTRGVHGDIAPEDALRQLLSGSGYGIHRDASGAVVIVRADQQAPAPTPAASTDSSSRTEIFQVRCMIAILYDHGGELHPLQTTGVGSNSGHGIAHTPLLVARSPCI